MAWMSKFHCHGRYDVDDRITGRHAENENSNPIDDLAIVDPRAQTHKSEADDAKAPATPYMLESRVCECS
jgi:hypothetical protein